MDRALIPEPLHKIMAEVEEWGHLSRDAQDRKLAKLLRDDLTGVVETAKRVQSLSGDLREWSVRLWGGKTHKSEYTDDDWKHPYWAFLSTLNVFESVPGVNDDDPEVQAATERMRSELRQLRVAAIKTDAAGHFRDKNYAKVVEALRSIEGDLTPAERTKLQYSEKQLSSK